MGDSLDVVQVCPSLGPGNYRRIARVAHVAPQHVGRVLKAKRGMSFEMAGRIARAAGVSLDVLYLHVQACKAVTRG